MNHDGTDALDPVAADDVLVEALIDGSIRTDDPDPMLAALAGVRAQVAEDLEPAAVPDVPRRSAPRARRSRPTRAAAVLVGAGLMVASGIGQAVAGNPAAPLLFVIDTGVHIGQRLADPHAGQAHNLEVVTGAGSESEDASPGGGDDHEQFVPAAPHGDHHGDDHGDDHGDHHGVRRHRDENSRGDDGRAHTPRAEPSREPRAAGPHPNHEPQQDPRGDQSSSSSTGEPKSQQQAPAAGDESGDDSSQEPSDEPSDPSSAAPSDEPSDRPSGEPSTPPSPSSGDPRSTPPLGFMPTPAPARGLEDAAQQVPAETAGGSRPPAESGPTGEGQRDPEQQEQGADPQEQGNVDDETANPDPVSPDAASGDATRDGASAQ